MRRLENKTVLIVDDEADIRGILRDHFEKLGARVLEAENGTQGVDLVEKTKVDAIISDIRMAGGSGTMLLDKIRGRYPKIPVVCLMSGHSDITNEEVINRGGLGLIEKPFRVSDIVKIVSEGLQRVEAAA